MSRVLNQAVTTGGVVYPAGTVSTPELEKRISNPTHWDGDPAQQVEFVRISGNYDDGPTAADLKQEIDLRNEGRDSDSLILVEGKGNKPDLVAALQADDAKSSS